MNVVVIPSLSDGVRWCFWTDTLLEYLDGWGKCCRYGGEWSRTRSPLNAARLLDFTCSFENSLYCQGLLPHYSSSDSKYFLCVILLLWRARACTHTHTHTCLPVFSRKGVTVTYTRNFLTQCSTNPIVFPDLVFICLGKTNSYNSFITLWHVTRAVLIPLLPLIQHLLFLWDITSFFFLP